MFCYLLACIAQRSGGKLHKQWVSCWTQPKPVHHSLLKQQTFAWCRELISNILRCWKTVMTQNTFKLCSPKKVEAAVTLILGLSKKLWDKVCHSLLQRHEHIGNLSTWLLSNSRQSACVKWVDHMSGASYSKIAHEFLYSEFFIVRVKYALM